MQGKVTERFNNRRSNDRHSLVRVCRIDRLKVYSSFEREWLHPKFDVVNWKASWILDGMLVMITR